MSERELVDYLQEAVEEGYVTCDICGSHLEADCDKCGECGWENPVAKVI